jgi:hypothetical protein
MSIILFLRITVDVKYSKNFASIADFDFCASGEIA